MSPTLKSTAGGSRWSGQLIATVLLCAIALVFVVRDGFPMLVAFVRPSATPEKVDVTTPLLSKHAEVHSTNLKRLENRYLFSIPPNWKRKAPPPPPVVIPKDPPPPPPPPAPPAEYSGPKPIGMFGSSVYFDNGRNVELGKEGDGVTVVEIVSSWELKLKHKGKVYDVTFGQRLPEDLFKPPTSRGSVPGITGGTAPSPESASAAASATTPAATPATTPAAAPAAASAATPAQPVTPPAAGGAPAPGDSGLKTAPATETVHPEIPAPLAEIEIARMTLQQAEEALQRIVRAQAAPNVDEATQNRMKTEMELLAARIREGEPAPQN
ncbi:MAG: hypothetical protein JNK53_03075 [Phycisphaerae bacterium]|nr:hypothetical protein [Phycisphaerae bacterium]